MAYSKKWTQLSKICHIMSYPNFRNAIVVLQKLIRLFMNLRLWLWWKLWSYLRPFLNVGITEDRIKELSELVDSGQFDSNEIRDKKENISNRYKHIQSLAANRKAQLLQAAYAIA